MNKIKQSLAFLPLVLVFLLIGRGQHAPLGLHSSDTEPQAGNQRIMALSALGYQTISPQPGLAGARGNYVPVTGANATFNGATQLTNGTDFLVFANSGPIVWGVYTGVNATGSPNYTNNTGTATSFPLTGWVGGTGFVPPVPTFAAISNSRNPLVLDAGQTREATAADAVNVPGSLLVNGVLIGNINQIEITGTAYALTDTDGILHFTGTAACAIALDSTYPAKTVLRIKNAGTASLNVSAGSGMTMEGNSSGTVTLAAGTSTTVGGALTLIRTGTKWEIY